MNLVEDDIQEDAASVITPHRVRLDKGNWIALVTLLCTVGGGITAAFYGLVNHRFTQVEQGVNKNAAAIDVNRGAISVNAQKIIRREAIAFTAQEGNVLSNTMSRLTLEFNQQQKAIDEQRTLYLDIQKQLKEVIEELRRVSPSDVKKEVLETKALLTELHNMLKQFRAQ